MLPIGQRLLVGGAGLSAALSVTGTAFAVAVAPSLNSASYTVSGNTLTWTVSLSRLTPGDTLAFMIGPFAASPTHLFPLRTGNFYDVLVTAKTATETFTFQSALPTVQVGGYTFTTVLYYLEASEFLSQGPATVSNELTLNTSGVGQLPEVPWAAALPLVAFAGAATVWTRKRRIASGRTAGTA